MRSLNPLTLKLHITENWMNIISYNNYSNDLHKIFYLNKWMKQVFSDKNNIVSKCFVFENNKKIFLNLNTTSFELLFNSSNKSFFRQRLSYLLLNMPSLKKLIFNNRKFRSYELSTLSFCYSKSPFLMQLISGLSWVEHDISTIVHNIYDFALRGPQYNYSSSLENIYGIDEPELFTLLPLVDFLEKTLTSFFKTRNFYSIIILKNFFFLFTTLEKYISNFYKKFVRLKINHFFIRYFGKKGSTLLNYQIKLARFVSRNLRKKKYLAIFINSCSLSALYSQPALLVDSLVRLLEISSAHRDIFSFLENYVNYFFRYFKFVGLKIRFTGRFRVNRSMRSQTRVINIGKSINVQTFSNEINYFSKVAYTFAGAINVQVWMC